MKTKFKNYWETHSIEQEIGTFAEDLELDCICTGGGFDFVFRKFECGVQAVLVGRCGFSPKKLDEASSVVVYQDENWTTWVEYSFNNAEEAMTWMKDMNPEAAGSA
jgi:hypothetical protein